MSNEPKIPEDSEELEIEDDPLTPEMEAMMQAHQIAWEAEATSRFGPPEVRLRKNRRYAARLSRRHSEPAIRGILKALSKLDSPMCCANLRNHDLHAEPLEQIIRPFDLLGLHFSIVSVSDGQFTVKLGESYGNVGSGGLFLLGQLPDDSFRVLDNLGQWIA